MVSSRELKIISWYDFLKGTWCAVATGYPHLAIGRASAMPPASETRGQAIDRLVALFQHYFTRGVGCNLTSCAVAEGTTEHAMQKMTQGRKRLFVGGLPEGVTENELHSMFSRHGTVAKVDLMHYPGTGAPQGFAFVEMELPSDARAAVAALDGIRMRGNPLIVKHA